MTPDGIRDDYDVAGLMPEGGHTSSDHSNHLHQAIKAIDTEQQARARTHLDALTDGVSEGRAGTPKGVPAATPRIRLCVERGG